MVFVLHLSSYKSYVWTYILEKFNWNRQNIILRKLYIEKWFFSLYTISPNRCKCMRTHSTHIQRGGGREGKREREREAGSGLFSSLWIIIPLPRNMIMCKNYLCSFSWGLRILVSYLTSFIKASWAVCITNYLLAHQTKVKFTKFLVWVWLLQFW